MLHERAHMFGYRKPSIGHFNNASFPNYSRWRITKNIHVHLVVPFTFVYCVGRKVYEPRANNLKIRSPGLWLAGVLNFTNSLVNNHHVNYLSPVFAGKYCNVWLYLFETLSSHEYLNFPDWRSRKKATLEPIFFFFFFGAEKRRWMLRFWKSEPLVNGPL